MISRYPANRGIYCSNNLWLGIVCAIRRSSPQAQKIALVYPVLKAFDFRLNNRLLNFCRRRPHDCRPLPHLISRVLQREVNPCIRPNATCIGSPYLDGAKHENRGLVIIGFDTFLRRLACRHYREREKRQNHKSIHIKPLVVSTIITRDRRDSQTIEMLARVRGS